MSIKINALPSNIGLHILLVEDDLLVQMIHRQKLEKLGCVVHVVPNGKEALEKSKSQYGLILLDWGLPDIDGIQVCRTIRQYEHINELPRVPIVIITAYPRTPETEKTCHEAGADAVIVKPVVEDYIWQQLVMKHFKFLKFS